MTKKKISERVKVVFAATKSIGIPGAGRAVSVSSTSSLLASFEMSRRKISGSAGCSPGCPGTGGRLLGVSPASELP